MPGNLNLPPPSIIASWPTPNYVDPVRRTWIPILCAVLQGVTTILVFARLGLRLLKKAGSMGLDDALLVPGFLASTMFTVVLMLSSMRYGTDRHLWDVPPKTYGKVTLLAWLSQIAYLISTSATKISVLLFYRRLVEGTYSRKWKWATLTAIALTVAYCIAFVLSLVFSCNPVDSYWKSHTLTYTKPYKCVNTTILNPVSGAWSIFSDLYSVILPMWILGTIQIGRRKRIALYAVFSLGLLVVAAGIVRTYYLYNLGHTYDLTWAGCNVFIWADLEVQLAIWCANVPVLRVLFKKLRGTQSQAMNNVSPGQSSNGNSARKVKPSVSTITIVDDRNSRYKPTTSPSMEVLNGCATESTQSHTPPTPPHDLENASDIEVYALQDLEHPRSVRRWQGPAGEPSYADLRPPESTLWRTPISKSGFVGARPSEVVDEGDAASILLRDGRF